MFPALYAIIDASPTDSIQSALSFGEKLVGGGVIEERDNFSLRVLHRQTDGTWLIVSEMYNDANREVTYEGHS